MRFALWSGASAVAGALVALPLAGATWGWPGVHWSLLGWLVTTLAGVAGGIWLLTRHGSHGSGFLVAVGVCMLARLIVFVAGPLAVASRGRGAALACVVGLFAGYVPTQATEVIWIARKTARA
jgi:hypothetical protein